MAAPVAQLPAYYQRLKKRLSSSYAITGGWLLECCSAGGHTHDELAGACLQGPP